MKRIVTFILVLSLLASLVGCGSQAAPETAQTASPAQTQSTQPPAPPAKPKLEIPELLASVRDPFALGAEQADTFYAFLDAQQVAYEFFDLYDFEGALSAWEQTAPYIPVGSELLSGGSLNKEAFLNQVKHNNAAFLAAAKDNEFSALADADFDRMFDIVCTGVGELLKRDIDEVLLSEKLADLKILSTNMPANGIMTHQNTILAVNLASVEAFQNSSQEADKFTGTILHEVMHLGQVSSDAERIVKNITVRVGPCPMWEAVMPYALYWEWYVEGSAEHLKMDIRGDEVPSVYEPYVRQLDAMSVALLPSCDPSTFHLQSLNADLSQFFTLLGADTREKQVEIMQMMCALDVALAQPESFDSAYKAQFEKPLGDRLNYNDRQINAANLTLAKIFYRQLCALAAQETTLAEVFSLIASYETEMTRAVRYHNNTERNRAFIDGYNAIQTAFFQQLAAATGMTEEDVRGQYLAWYYSEEALDLPHLSAERQSWLQDRMAKHAEQFPRRNAIYEFAQ